MRFGDIDVDTAEKELLAAVLMQAHLDMRGGAGATHADAVDAYRWIVSRAWMFRLICDVLGMDAETVRERLIRVHAKRCEAILRNCGREAECVTIH